MLIGIRLSDLGRRSRWLLALASVAFAATIVLWLLAPAPSVRLLQAWLLAVVLLGLYWLSFLADFRARLGGAQLVVATLFALLPWILVLAIVFAFPQVVLGHAPA